MNFFKNKHIVTALLVAPILAVLGYVLADRSVAEKPDAARSGQSYPLVARSNCRYQSGLCTLVNGDIKINLTANRLDARSVELIAESDLPISQALIAAKSGQHDGAAQNMTPQASGWRLRMGLAQPDQTLLRMAFTIDGAVYFVETSAAFVDYRTGYSKENFPG